MSGLSEAEMYYQLSYILKKEGETVVMGPYAKFQKLHSPTS